MSGMIKISGNRNGFIKAIIKKLQRTKKLFKAFLKQQVMPQRVTILNIFIIINK